MKAMQITNNILKWSFVLSSASGLLFLGSVFASWLIIQILVVLTGIAA
jgi:hypothetical protein